MKARQKKNGKKNKKSSFKQRGPMYWVAMSAMGTLVAYSAFGSKTVSLARTHENRSAITINQSQTPSARRFDIPPGPLDTVLNTFQNMTGVRVVVPNSDIGTIPSPGVAGVYTTEEALKKILTGTGVTYRFISSESVALEVSGPSSSVDVSGQISIVSSPKYTEPLRDLPQTISVIPKSVIEEQGATTLRDVLRNVPGLTIAAGEGGNPAGDNLTLRGFSARNDVFIDGVRDLSPQARDPFNLEQVEVVKGPSSTYSGRGSAGGTINLVSKSPSLDPLYGFTLNLGTDRTKRFTGDLNLPLERLGLGKRTDFRLNFLAHESGVAGRDVVENQRWGVAPSLAFGVGTPTRLTLSYFKLKQDNISDYGIPWVPVTNNALVEFRDKPAPVPRDTFYGFKNRDAEKLNSDLATVKFEHDFSDNLTFRNQTRYGRSTRDSIATPPRFADINSTVIAREMRSWLTEDEIWDNQTDLRSIFSTGKVSHSLAAGVAFSREENERRFRTAPNAFTTLLNPNPNDVYTGAFTVSPLVGNITGNSLATYAFDTMKFGQKFELSGGLRWDYFDAEGVSVAGTPQALVNINRIDRMLSWRAGAVYKPRTNGSIYAAYGTSLNPSLEGLSYNTANTAIEPEKTYTFEVGSKWDMFRDRLLLSLAGFRVDKTNARTPGLLPDEPVQVLQGEQRVYGIEFGATGSITRVWKLFAAYTYLDSEIVESNTPAEVGRELQNTPKHSLNLWTTYQFPFKLNFGGGARFVDGRFGNNINTRRVDSYWTIDMLASYPLNDHIDLRFNLYNLANEFYFDRLGGGHLVPGPARSANVSVGFRF
ncbi:MAG TPA: TonB-dependent siderophore receptor [Blastocatellia bacterium]|nr:TonB-dependent siderophore receptor [Blastocatellia bacterium]